MYGIYKLKIVEAFQLDDFLNYHMKILYQYSIWWVSTHQQKFCQLFFVDSFCWGENRSY